MTCWKPRALAAALLLATPAWAAPAAANEFDCLIEANQMVEIRSPIVGLLQQVHARRGETIRAGQLLVTIESSVEQSAADAARLRAESTGGLQLARGKVAALREKARRLTALAEEEFVSTQAGEDARAELSLAESELRQAEEGQRLAQAEHRQTVDQLARRQIRSPFAGVVVDQYLNPGALVDAGDGKKPILKIAQTQPLAVQVILPFRLFPQIQPGQRVVVRPEAPFGGTIDAVIRTKDRVIDAAAGTFGVVATLDNARQTLPAGIRCKLQVPGLK
jgi:RND family efflux transporter MFP subunit